MPPGSGDEKTTGEISPQHSELLAAIRNEGRHTRTLILIISLLVCLPFLFNLVINYKHMASDPPIAGLSLATLELGIGIVIASGLAIIQLAILGKRKIGRGFTFYAWHVVGFACLILGLFYFSALTVPLLAR